LIDYGFLTVSAIERNKNKGIVYLFSEQELAKLDIPSSLAEIQDIKSKNFRKISNSSRYSQVIRTLNHYDNFLTRVENLPEEKLLKICFYLFHLNHYAKSYPEKSRILYNLKNQTLEKMYHDYPGLIIATYLAGPDRYKVWLCEDCRSSASSSGMSFRAFIQNEHYCSKCYIQSIEREYYSLIEFVIEAAGYRFCFHLPRSSAEKWFKEMNRLPQGIRKLTRYYDTMYLYGRRISRIEKRLFPLAFIIEQIHEYLGIDTPGSD
jgi:hypothetical protein